MIDSYLFRGCRWAALAAIGLVGSSVHAEILDPTLIPQFQTPLVIPPAMPKSNVPSGTNGDYYEIAVRQFNQRILPNADIYGRPLGMTTVWSYGSVNHPGTFNYPAFTIEAQHGRKVFVKWINDLKDAQGRFLPHLLTVDPTLHWANPGGGIAGRDSRPTFSTTPDPYGGPVPMVVHVHGAHTTDDSDGYAEAWYLPDANNIPSTYAKSGRWYEPFKNKYRARNLVTWPTGTAIMEYPNDQRATTLWYHDHTLGMTRLNVYAGPAGFYLLRGGPDDVGGNTLPKPAPALGDEAGKRYYEIPLAIQDRTFKTDGSLHYPISREEFDGVTGPYLPHTDISPYWNPEFFGNTMLVNGKTWPFLNVEARRYRFRVLNGCNSRFLILRLSDPRAKMWQIGAEGGFIGGPIRQYQLLMAPAERADIIVDFSGVPLGTEVTMTNVGPDEPFKGGIPGLSFEPANPLTTGRVMKFRVGARIGLEKSTPVEQLRLPVLNSLPTPTATRQVSLMEMMSMDFPDAPSAAMLGTMMNGVPHHQMWDDPITEWPVQGRTETWEIYNFTADAHPIHLHQVQFQVVNRQGLVTDSDGEVQIPVVMTGAAQNPMPWEKAFKDTVIAYPGQVTRLNARFDLLGLFVWHCHIVEHEDNEMMRPLYVRR